MCHVIASLCIGKSPFSVHVQITTPVDACPTTTNHICVHHDCSAVIFCLYNPVKSRSSCDLFSFHVGDAICAHTRFFVHNKKVYSEYPQLHFGLQNGSKQNIVSLLFQHHFNTFIDYDSESLWTNNAVTWSNFLCLATAFFFLLSLSFSFFPWAV